MSSRIHSIIICSNTIDPLVSRVGYTFTEIIIYIIINLVKFMRIRDNYLYNNKFGKVYENTRPIGLSVP